ncbi:UNVERIFIED_CONTAM: hypothetical protein NCL1_57349, partial [Trichonephila clavipes]
IKASYLKNYKYSYGELLFGDPFGGLCQNLKRIHGNTSSMMSILAEYANSFIVETAFSADGVFCELRRLSFLSRKNS